LNALLQEIDERKSYLQNETIQTIYYGGGTPSLLQAVEIETILRALKQQFDLVENPEITLELNPEDVSKTYLKEIKNIGINRLSIGVQSFFNDDLAYLNRKHSVAQAQQVISDAQECGFEKLTIDLIYGIPTLTDEKWNKNLDLFFQFGLKHLSAYALTVEPRTVLARRIEMKKAAAIDENQSIRHFEQLIQRMEANNFVHYEISNFAQPGHYSKHNSLYWLGANYIGLGPSAHSYNGSSRQWNTSNIDEYLQSTSRAQVIFEKEILTKTQKYDEYVMTSLRTSWGCDLEHIKNVFGNNFADYCLKEAQKHIKNNLLKQEGNRLYLTNQGKLFADGIAADLFCDETI
jgi:oxygen-independent coproporphyrinogen-3 oxidase